MLETSEPPFNGHHHPKASPPPPPPPHSRLVECITNFQVFTVILALCSCTVWWLCFLTFREHVLPLSLGSVNWF